MEILLDLLRDGFTMNSSREERKDFLNSVRGLGARPLLAGWQHNKLLGGKELNKAKLLLPSLADKELFFVISFHKTGTRSTNQYFENLGLKSVHWPVFANTGIDYQSILKAYITDPDKCILALAPLFERYDILSDVPFPGLWRQLAEFFHNAKFILIYREPEAWWNSIRNHWNLSHKAHSLDCFEAIQYGLPVGTKVEDTEFWKSQLTMLYSKHVTAVRTYFSSRPNDSRLLEIDLLNPNISSVLSSFVDHPLEMEFPRISKGLASSRH